MLDIFARGAYVLMVRQEIQMTSFYAAQSPRGFANEINVHQFRSRKERDAWVAEHTDDGDVNSASRGAYVITSRRAKAILAYAGDAATESFNSAVAH
jgi:hypothetical protein